MKRKRNFLKHLSVVKEVFQAFGILVDKEVNFIEAFKCATTSVSLAVSILNHTLYQPYKA